MKIQLLLCICLLLFSQALTAQSNSVQFLVDTAITIMKQNAANTGSIDWKTVQKTALVKAAGIPNPYGLGAVMRYLYESVNDFHGAFFYKDSMFQWRRNVPIVSDSIMNEWKKGVQSITMMPGHDIGYLRIPSMPMRDNNDFNIKAQSLNDSLCFLLQQHPKGVILDLRLNGGGAMHPMILGVEQLLGEGNIGSFRTKNKEEWILKSNSFFIDTIRTATIHPSCSIDAQDLPVVILTGPNTGSAAECFIIAFKGRPNTVLLGSATAGYVTVNTGFPINDTAFMNLAVGYSADRNGTVYKAVLTPDIPFTSVDRFNDIAGDEKVKAAIKWFHLHCY